MLMADGLTVRAGGRWVLEGASFKVEAGQTLLVTGGNGVGKSLLARTVAGLVPPAAGCVTVDGLAVKKRKARRHLGYLPQDGGLYEYLSVAENLKFFAALAGVGWRQRKKVCTDLLELVGLGAVADLEASRLTPGQRQRLGIARALAGDPRGLVLDEPLQGLDAGGRADIRHLLVELAGMGKAILICTGDPDGLAHDRLLVLEDGKLKGGDAA